MTEPEWLACEDPGPMLEFLKGKASRRKVGLWVAACFRAILSPDHQFRGAVEVMERYVEGECGDVELEAMHQKYHTILVTVRDSNSFAFASMQVSWLMRDLPDRVAPLLRDVTGPLPFHPITLSPSWLTSTVLSLANQMYDTRDFSAMPILADALQDASCDNETILTHCRGPGPHTRGCWVVDLLTNRE